MPKRKRFRKEKGDDAFKKKKTKLGRTKQAASNATNTTIDSKELKLPSQSALDDDRQSFSSHLRNLLSKSHHYNINIRYDAIHGLVELLKGNPDEFHSELVPVVEKVVDLMGDAMQKVRFELRTLFRNLCFEFSHTLSSTVVPLLLIHTRAAMTNVDRNTQIDALSFLDCWCEYFPLQIQKASNEFILVYVPVLNNVGLGVKGGESSRSSKILQSFSTFLQTILVKENSEISVGTEKQIKWKGDSVVRIERSVPHILPSVLLTASSQSYDTRLLQTLKSGSSRVDKEEILRPILKILLKYWLEWVPAKNDDVGDLQSGISLLKLLTIVLKANHNDTVSDTEKLILTHLISFFPLPQPPHSTKMITDVDIVNMHCFDVIVCLIGRVLKSSADSYVFENIQETVVKYCVQMIEFLGTKSIGNYETSIIQILFGKDIINELNFTEISLSMLLHFVPHASRAEIYGAISDLVDRVSSSNYECVLGVLRLIRWVVVDCKDDEPEIVGKWVSWFPRLLWQLGDKRNDITSFVLQIMWDIGRRTDLLDSVTTAFRSTQTTLLPFFSTIIKTNQRSVSKRIFGPFSKLNENLQLQCISVLNWFPSLDSALWQSLAACISTNTLPASTITSILELLMKHFVEKSVNITFFLSFCMSILKVSKEESKGKNRLKCTELVWAICRVVQSVAIHVEPRGAVLEIMTPFIKSLLIDDATISQLRGGMALVAACLPPLHDGRKSKKKLRHSILSDPNLPNTLRPFVVKSVEKLC